MRQLIYRRYSVSSLNAITLANNVTTVIDTIPLPEGKYCINVNSSQQITRGAFDGTETRSYLYILRGATQESIDAKLQGSAAIQGSVYFGHQLNNIEVDIAAGGETVTVVALINADGTVIAGGRTVTSFRVTIERRG